MIWFENENIAIFFSQKSDGDMLFEAKNNLRNEKVRANRISFFGKHGIDPERLINLAAVHGANITTLTRQSKLGSGALDPTTRVPNTDGLITDIKNSYLMVTGADCFPVFFYDEIKQIIGAAHCGWRGIIGYTDLHGLNTDQSGPSTGQCRQKQKAKGIIEEMIMKFQNDFSSNPFDIHIWIGPGIKSCHYDVSRERADLFSKKYKEHIINRGGKIFLDLAGVIKSQLLESGLDPQNITEYPDCTFCNENLFSHRRRIAENNPQKGAMGFIIHLK